MFMSSMQWILFITIVIDGILAGYYQLQMLGYSKSGRLSSVWRGGWIMHPEYLDDGGQPYRKKLFISLVVFAVLVFIMNI